MTLRGRSALVLAAALGGAAVPGVALAHGSGADAGTLGAALGSWSPEPVSILLVAALGGGLFLLRRRLTRVAPGYRRSPWRDAALGAGVLVLALALLSPVDGYADDLFWAHMVQHVLLMAVVAPLLLLGAPLSLVLRASTPAVRRAWLVPLLTSRLLVWLTRPPVALALFAGTVWLWHLPALYDAALRMQALHALEHVTFLSAAILFWWLIIEADPSRLRPSHPVRAALLFAAIVQGLLLGVLLLVVEEPLYDVYVSAAAARDWGPSDLADQEAAAGLVWIPSGIVFALALLITLQRWLEAMEQRAQLDDARRVRALEAARAQRSAPLR